MISAILIRLDKLNRYQLHKVLAHLHALSWKFLNDVGHISGNGILQIIRQSWETASYNSELWKFR